MKLVFFLISTSPEYLECTSISDNINSPVLCEGDVYFMGTEYMGFGVWFPTYIRISNLCFVIHHGYSFLRNLLSLKEVTCYLITVNISVLICYKEI